MMIVVGFFGGGRKPVGSGKKGHPKLTPGTCTGRGGPGLTRGGGKIFVKAGKGEKRKKRVLQIWFPSI